MADYHETVIPYLNTTPKLDDAVFSLWERWNDNKDKINVEAARRDFFKATAISPNIGRTDHYVPHCLQVSRRCEETGMKVAKNYPLFTDELNPNKLAFMGLVEDSFYLIGGNGKNNPNGEDSNPYHEILTFLQMQYMGYNKLADEMAMHGISSEMLEVEQRKGKFRSISPPQQNISLDILIGIDFLCTRDFLPNTHGSYEDCLKFRVADIRERRNNPSHPLIVGLDNGGEERLLEILDRIHKMETGRMTPKEIESFYIR